MAGSNREKLRVLFVKNRTYLEIFLNVTGRRVDINKRQGLLCKMDRRTGIYAWGPMDLDLTVQKGSGHDLI